MHVECSFGLSFDLGSSPGGNGKVTVSGIDDRGGWLMLAPLDDPYHPKPHQSAGEDTEGH